MRRFALALGVVSLLAAGGLASAILAAGPHGGSTTTSTAPASTSTTPSTTTVESTAPSVLAFTGHGWGHGLGMSQWGAYGYARHGWTYDRILAHYYTGTTLGQTTVSTVRVLLVSAKMTTLSSLAPWTVKDAAGTTTALDPSTVVLTPKLALDAAPHLQPPLAFTSKTPITVDGHVYRGRLVVSTDGKLLSVVDVVGLEQYVKGVVPAEMPSSWAPEALKAQAIATRSYALANVAKGRPFDLYGDTRSQVYGGVTAEAASASKAVDATKGQVLLYNGKIADTLFFSTSGGRTASALESTGIAVPYLVPVVDPYDTLSPYHDWGPVLFDAAKVAKQLKLSATIADVSAVDGPSERVKSLVITGSDESTVTLTGNQLRTALGLRSTWFTPVLLQLQQSAKTMTYGGAISLTGSARGADGVSLETKAAGLDWAPAGDLVPAADGTFSLVVKPQVATSYRLAWGTVRAGLVKVAVAARVSATLTPAGLSGSSRPVLAGAAVQLQRQDAAVWTTVATTVTDTTSGWSFPGALPTGSYRVRVAPGHGIAPGVTAPISVP